MSDFLFSLYRRSEDESPSAFGQRLRAAASALAADDGASSVVVFVDDGATGAPPEADAMPSRFDGAMLTAGVAFDSLPHPDACYAVRRRVVKGRDRGTGGARSEGFTVVCPSVRLGSLTREQFDAHWRDNHSRVHVSSSPGTCHYEQLPIDAACTPDAPDWDGIGLLSFATASDYSERLFDGERGQRAIYEDVERFLDLAKGETLPASEYVYRDTARRPDPVG